MAKESSHSIVKSILLPGGATTKPIKNFVIFKQNRRGSLIAPFGTGLIELGTPRLGTDWAITWGNLTSEDSIEYEKETELAPPAGPQIEAAQWTVVIAIEFLVANVSQLVQYSSQTTLPVGPGGPKTNREGILTGAINLPQPLPVPGGQTLYAQMFHQVIAVEGPEKAKVYEELNSAIHVLKAVPIELVLGYTQKDHERKPIRAMSKGFLRV